MGKKYYTYKKVNEVVDEFGLRKIRHMVALCGAIM